MFHHRTDASKAALVGLVDQMTQSGNAAENGLIDVQWLTPHLASLGIVEIPREQYLERSALARLAPIPAAFT
jgi:leucyl/phenylalanyl-tRNA--protein transferase